MNKEIVPVLKVCVGLAELFPKAPSGSWGCPFYPLLATNRRPLAGLPPGADLRLAINRVMASARLPVPVYCQALVAKKWRRLLDDPELGERQRRLLPRITWPEETAPQPSAAGIGKLN